MDLGFGFLNKTQGTLTMPPDQMDCIINFDETAGSIDGNQGNRGGRPSMMFYDPNMPQTGEVVSKSSTTFTMIPGSTANGDALPPHFQLSTTTKTDEGKRLKYEMIEYFSICIQLMVNGALWRTKIEMLR